jgi:hypothetical protein
MNNEPVAWRKSETDSEGQYFVYREEEPRWLEGYIPLYTHPAKTLTDEEILELWDWNSGEILATDLLDFADAILRKAQEK